LADDPFRTLAKKVEGRRKGWRKTSTPFCELHWADYLRQHRDQLVAAAGGRPQDIFRSKRVEAMAVELCRRRNKRTLALPGHVGKTDDPRKR
jgi:hypothetical protein